MSHFDYENAKRDIRDAGGDPDYLSHYNEAARDRYLKGMGLNPRSYGGGRTAEPKSRSAGVSKSRRAGEPKSRRAGVPQYSSSDAQADYTWSTVGYSGTGRQPLMTAREEKELKKYAVDPEEMKKRLLFCAIFIGIISVLEIVTAVRDGEASNIILAGALILLLIVEWVKLKNSAGMRRELVKFVAAKQAYEAGDIKKAQELMQEVDSSQCGKFSELVEKYGKIITEFRN